MTIAFDRIDASAVGAAAAELLQRAWEPPCLWYSPEYLKWEFARPGDDAAIAFGAFEAKSRLVGFTGAVRRRACIGDWIGDVWLLSFVAVSPEHRRRGIGRRLYAEFFAAAEGTPALIFARPGTPGDHLRRSCLASMPSATRETRSLRVCRTYGYGGSRASSAGASSSYLVEAVTEHDTWMQLLRVGPPHAERLIAWPDASAFDHSRRDPRGRTFHVVRDTDGRPIAGAAAFHQETRTPGGGGVQRTPSIECVVLHETTPSAVAALVSCAAGGMPALIPNLSMIDETVLRPAGLRATRSEFLAHLAGPVGHAALAASSTNIEVV